MGGSIKVVIDNSGAIDGRSRQPHLAEGWSEAITYYIASLGNDGPINLAALHDWLVSEGYLSEKRIITIGTIFKKKYADIEDLFTVSDYLTLYNRAFDESLKEEDLKGKDPIVAKIARHHAIERFDHGKPADILLRHRDEILQSLSEVTISNFERLFDVINGTSR